MYRGSRKHVLDWLERPHFAPELLGLLAPAIAKVIPRSVWAPAGYRLPDEARLDAWGPECFGAHLAWAELEHWWLREPRGANTPNWDLALVAEIEGELGLVLVEAKANVPELSTAGKGAPSHSDGSRANHERIGLAIESARSALLPACPQIAISRDSHYQLSNRIAFAWKLASLGIPVILVYLGFLGDEGIRDVGEPFADADHWHSEFEKHVRAVGATELLEKRHKLEGAPFWFLARAKRVLESSSSAA